MDLELAALQRVLELGDMPPAEFAEVRDVAGRNGPGGILERRETGVKVGLKLATALSDTEFETKLLLGSARWERLAGLQGEVLMAVAGRAGAVGQVAMPR